MGITGTFVEVRACTHRKSAEFFYISNDGMTPPVICVAGCWEQTILTMTNQVIRASCPLCFELVRQAATRLTPVVS